MREKRCPFFAHGFLSPPHVGLGSTFHVCIPQELIVTAIWWVVSSLELMSTLFLVTKAGILYLLGYSEMKTTVNLCVREILTRRQEF